VDSDEYLWRCLRYIELNMVRCAVVAHPKEWEWVGHHEIMGDRSRYRLSPARFGAVVLSARNRSARRSARPPGLHFGGGDRRG
jgi:hypothetical protein